MMELVRTILNEIIDDVIQRMEKQESKKQEQLDRGVGVHPRKGYVINLQNRYVKPISMSKKICGDAFYEKFHTGKIYFKMGRKSTTYFEVDRKEAIEILNQRINRDLYEVIHPNTHRKLCIDIDNKDGKMPFCYNDIVGFIKEIEEYSRSVGYIKGKEKLDYNIQLSFSGVLPTIEPSEKIFTSSHIIFQNLIFKSHMDCKIFMNRFLTDYKGRHHMEHPFKTQNYIDMSVYSIFQLFRAVNQAKKPTQPPKYLRKIQLTPLTHKLRINKIADERDLITLTHPNPIIIEPTQEENKKSIPKNSRVLNCLIPVNKSRFKKIQKETTSYDFINTGKWNKLLYSLLYTLHTSGVQTQDVLEHELTKEFILRSRVGKYDTDETEKNNKNRIQTTYENKHFLHYSNIHINIITYPCNEEIDWIENKTNKTPTLVRVIKNTPFFIIDAEWIYNPNYKTLLYKYKYIKDEKDKTDIICKKEFNYNIENIPKDIEKKYENYEKQTNYKQIEDLKKVEIQDNKNIYIQAPVGTGKTFIVIKKILQQLLQNTDYKILVVSDVITLTKKQLQDMRDIAKEVGYDKDIIYHYQSRCKLIAEHKKVVITTYDSLHKVINHFQPSHIIIDEFQNTMKRTIYAGGNDTTNEQRKDKLQMFHNLLNSQKAYYLLDADHEELFTKKLKIDTHYKLINTNKPHTISVYREKQALCRILKDVREKRKIVIATSSKKGGQDYEVKILKEAKKCGRNLTLLFIEKEGATTSSKWKNKEGYDKKKLKDEVISNTDLWKDYDVVIYTPTIQTGVSFNDKTYFDRVYIIAVNMTIDATQMSQFTNRVRETTSNEIVIISKNIHHTINHKQVEQDRIEEDTTLHNEICRCGGTTNTRREETADYYLQLTKHIQKLLIQRQQSILYFTLRTLYDWGFKKIEPRFYQDAEVTEEKQEKTDHGEVEENITTRTLQKTEYIEANHLEEYEFKELHQYFKSGVQHHDQKAKDYLKTLHNKMCGYSRTHYNKHKKEIDAMYNPKRMDAELEHMRKLNLLSYHFYKELIYEIVATMDTSQTYMERFLKDRHTTLKISYKKLYNFYILFKILDIFNITDWNTDFKQLLYTGLSVYKKEKLERLYELMEKEKNIVSYLSKVNKARGNPKNKYSYLSSVMTSLFYNFGLKVKMGEKRAISKIDKSIHIFIPILEDHEKSVKEKAKKKDIPPHYPYRIQTTLNQETDDEMYYNTPKYVKDFNCKTEDYDAYAVKSVLYGGDMRFLKKVKLSNKKTKEGMLDFINLFIEKEKQESYTEKVENIYDDIITSYKHKEEGGQEKNQEKEDQEWIAELGYA